MFKKILVMMFVMISFSAAAEDAKNESKKLDLYYFYNNTRCFNCREFERMTKELAPSLPVNLKLVNVQDKGNEHYIKDYKLFSKSIIVVNDKGHYRNLDKIWSLVRDEEKFKKYVTDEVHAFAKEAK